MEHELSNNQFIPQNLLALIDNHSDPDALEQEVRQLLNNITSQSALRKRYETWIANKRYPNKIPQQQQWISDYDQAVSYLKRTLDRIPKWRRAKNDYESKLDAIQNQHPDTTYDSTWHQPAPPAPILALPYISPPPPPPSPQPLPRYVDSDEYKQRMNEVEANKLLDDYSIWRSHEDKDQSQDVDELFQQLASTPDDWSIDFDDFNTGGKIMVFDRLKQFFETTLSQLTESSDYRFTFNVLGQWHTKPFTPELYRQLLSNFDKLQPIYDIGEAPNSYSSDDELTSIPEWSYFTAIRFSKRPQVQSGYNDRGGHFFKYLVRNVPQHIINYLTRLQIFDTLLGDEDRVRPELNDCCFIYALHQSCIPDTILNKMRLVITSRYLSPKKISKLCTDHSIHCVCTYIDDNTTPKHRRRELTSKGNNYLGVDENIAKYSVKLACYEQHYFIDEPTPYSPYYIKHLDDNLPVDRIGYRHNGDHWMKDKSRISSATLVRILMDTGHFIRINYGQYGILNTTFYDTVDKNLDYDLEYEDTCVRKIEPHQHEPFIDNVSDVYFADFEADVSGDIHIPFMVCYMNSDGSKKGTFTGPDCGAKLLEVLPDHALVYFHNQSYDIRMIARYGITKTLVKGSRTLSAEVEYGRVWYEDANGKKRTRAKVIYMKDTLAIFSCKLSALPAMFNLQVHKELFPYKYYTIERLKTNVGIINGVGAKEDTPWTAADYDTFRHNIDLTDSRLSDTTFDMYKYATFYCMQDVDVLRQAFNQFRADLQTAFHIDLCNELTISGVAHRVFRQNVYEPNGNLYEVSGHVQHFIQQAVHGGRCMTAYNKKWHTTVPLCDFDAVSLYPSAMARLYTVEGKPHVIQPDQLNMEFLGKQSAYVVKIRITAINKHYAFPLIVTKGDDGLNHNDDTIKLPIVTHVCDIELEDYIKYQCIEFELIEGYYWNGDKDYRIQQVIRDLFNKRLECKRRKSSQQAVFKLIMNSCYGKTIQKPVLYDRVFKHDKDIDKYWCKNYNKIIESFKLHDSDIHCIKVRKQVSDQYNFSLLGVHILAMSKRIMNEVMCLAYDLGIKIYYQDTDSMHIEQDSLGMLSDAFRQQYGRELIGSDMGQFHSDFDPISKDGKNTHAIESYFIGKKLYVDKLTDSTDAIGYHIRGKGLTQQSIKALAQQKYDGDPMKLYQALYDGDTLTFDLTVGQPSFEIKNDYTVSSRTEFIRRVRGRLPAGC